MAYLNAFLCGGLLCAVGQILIDRTRLTPARILTGYVVAGVFLSAVGLYQPLADWGGAGATVPLTGFGHALAKGVEKAVAEQGWDPLKDVNIIAQPPEVAGSALQAGKIDAHADFVPFADLLPHRGFARKIFDGAQTKPVEAHGAAWIVAHSESGNHHVIEMDRAEVVEVQQDSPGMTVLRAIVTHPGGATVINKDACGHADLHLPAGIWEARINREMSLDDVIWQTAD